MTWRTVKLGELARVRTGKLDANAADENGLYPFFTCAVEPLSINTPAFDCKAILVAGNGDLNVKYYEGKFNAYQRTYVIESLDEKIILPRYLYLFLNEYVNELRALAIGGVIKYIKLANLTDAPIPLPPLAEQERIAAILDKAELVMYKRQLAIEKLNDLAQSLFVEMFGDFNKKSQFHKLEDLNNLIMETKLGLVRGASELNDSNGYPYLRMNAITSNGELQFNKLMFADASDAEVKEYALKKHDFLFNTRNSKELVGKTAIFLNENNNYLFNNNIMRMRFNQNANPFYIAYAFKTQYVQNQLENIKSGTTNVFAIYFKDLKNIKIPLPNIADQNTFALKIAALDLLKNKFKENVNAMKVFNASLQNQAFKVGFNA